MDPLELTVIDNASAAKIADYTESQKDYTLVEAYSMRLVLEKLDSMITRLKEIRVKIGTNYARTISEYQEGGVTESDGVFIKCIKEGRRELLKEAALQLFPDQCNEVSTFSESFDFEKCKAENLVFQDFLTDHAEILAPYFKKTQNFTLTALEKKLTPEEVQQVITRAPSTYGVELL